MKLVRSRGAASTAAPHASKNPAVSLASTVAPAAEDEVMAGRVGQDLEQALLALPVELREVLRAMVLDGLSVRETSLLLGVPEGTVKSRINRGRSELARQIRKLRGEHFSPSGIGGVH